MKHADSPETTLSSCSGNCIFKLLTTHVLCLGRIVCGHTTNEDKPVLCIENTAGTEQVNWCWLVTIVPVGVAHEVHGI